MKTKEQKAEYQKEWRKKNKERIREYSKKYYDKNAEHLRQYSRDYMLTNADVKAITKREARKKKRLEAITKLGGKCVHCGYDVDSRALQIDHINGGGVKEMKEIGTMGILNEVLKEGSEKKYQLLCANCNWIKRWDNKEYIPSKWRKYE